MEKAIEFYSKKDKGDLIGIIRELQKENTYLQKVFKQSQDAKSIQMYRDKIDKMYDGINDALRFTYNYNGLDNIEELQVLLQKVLFG